MQPPNLDELAALLVAMGCPPEKSLEMAEQLQKRAQQLAVQKSELRRIHDLSAQADAARLGRAGTRPMIKPWERIRSEKLADFRVFSVRSDVKVSPRTGNQHDFFVIESVNWVNVIPVTPRNELVMIKQYRHGSNTIELEVPGGMMDPGETSPVIAGTRELREETGYEGEEAQIIGEIFPNPAIMNNICYTLLVKNCVLKHPTDFDHGEDLITHLVPVPEIPKLVAAGIIRHSLVAVALYHFDLWQRGAAGK